MNGNLNELVTYALLWDLHDAANAAEAFDQTNSTTDYIIKSTFTHMPAKLKAAPVVDRGFAGADLVDFLDGYRCQSVTSGGFGAETDLKSLVNTHFAFPYDFSATVCP